MTGAIVAPGAEGFLVGAGLIIAIGAQNVFVLRQGLLGLHAGAVATVCAVSDAVLIAIGVAGAGSLVRGHPGLLATMTVGGAGFLTLYGALALWRALRPKKAEIPENTQRGLAAAVAASLALTFLNPHVYLDTVVLIGALSARYEGWAALSFGAGAAAASLGWFFGLAFGARLAAPLFTRPQAWRYLDTAVGITMLAIAARLVGEALVV